MSRSKDLLNIDPDVMNAILSDIIDAMEPKDKDDLTNQIRDLLQSLLSRGLSEEEIAIVIMQDIVIPELEKKKDQQAQLAFAHKSSKYYQ